MQGKQVIREFFLENDISCIFQLPGLHTLSLTAELFRAENVKSITTRHEANCAFMADGYARASGKPAVLIVTPGPGLGNIVAGCMEAYSDDVPLFILHVDTDRKDAGKGILHEIEKPENIFRYFTKGTFRVTGAANLRHFLDTALRRCTEPRTGPVLVSVPFSLLEKEVPPGQHSEPFSPVPGPEVPLNHFLRGCDDILSHRTKPVLIGGGALMHSGAGPVVEEILARGVPFLTSTGGKGMVSDRSPFAFGTVTAGGVSREILDSADIVIAAGTRLRNADSKRQGVRIHNLIHIDVDDRWMNRNYPAVLSFAGDVEAALKGLSDIIRARTFAWDLAALKEKRRAEKESLRSAPGHTLVSLIRDAVPDDTVIVCDLNIPSYWAERYLPVYFPRSFLMPRGVSPIFYSLSAAIGAKLARPVLPCLALCGDGGILPQTAELATIVKYRIPVVIFVHNNMGYGVLEDAIHSRYGIDGSMQLENPDFVALATSYGIRGVATDSLDGLKALFKDLVTWDEPFLVEYKDTSLKPPWG